MTSLTLLTFSGAHGTGKTTLSDDVAKRIEIAGIDVIKIPSCSSEQFRRWARKTQVRTYDDINRLGLRVEWQEGLAGLLRDSVVDALNKINPLRPTCLIVDRWFSDIQAYSAMEVADPDELDRLHGICKAMCVSTLAEFYHLAELHYLQMEQCHVIVPIMSADFVIDNKENRGTCDRTTWEKHFTRNVGDFGHSHYVHRIVASDRQTRVGEVLRGIGLSVSGHPVHAERQGTSAHG